MFCVGGLYSFVGSGCNGHEVARIVLVFSHTESGEDINDWYECLLPEEDFKLS